MDLTPFIKAVESRLRDRKLDMRGVSEEIGRNETYVRDIIKRRSRNPEVEGLVALANYLDLNPSEFFSDGRRRGTKDAGPMVPIVGYIGAGATILPIDDFPKGQGLDDIPCPVGMNPDRTVAAIVRGSSMEPLIPDGWRVFYSRDPEQDAAGVVGKLCVVKLSDGPTMLKQVRRGHSPGRFNLISTNAALLEDQALDWASPVRAMQAPDNDAAVDDRRPVVPVRRAKRK
jgi:hypothetical protein